jgi:hypothetical protein
MNLRSQIADLCVRYGDGLTSLEAEVLRTLEISFEPILTHLQCREDQGGRGEIMADPQVVADRLARIMLHFSRVAAVPSMHERAMPSIATRVLEFVRRGVPVEAQMLWSPKKHWTQGHDSAVDLAELMALQTLVTISSAVSQVYWPGMSFMIDIEDIEFEFMEGQNNEMVVARDLYISGMRWLIRTLGLGELFTLRRTSERATSPEELTRWRQQIAENYRALESYWYKSEGCPAPTRDELSSLKKLAGLGWRGTIPPEMRTYYLTRLGRLAGSSEPKKVDMVLRNLAGILLHYQAGLLRGSGMIDPVKFSFVRSADAAPPDLLRARVDLRFVPRKVCSRVSAAAPWATKGFLFGHTDGPRISFRGWHELAGARCRFAEGWFTIARANDAAQMRADFMREACD